MKNFLFISLAFLMTNSMNAQVKAYKDIYFGMTKSEAKSVFKKDKQAYTNAQIGSFLYRIYTQNFVYNEKGKLFQIALTAKGGGLYGVLESEAMDRLRDLVRFANANGYTSDGVTVGASEFEFNKNAEYLFISPEKDKFMKLVFVPNPSSNLVYCTLWTGLYDENVVDARYKTNDF
jgi:hypothetical protein